jgi:RNA polymerase sigma factor (sigma-70 family)
MAAPELNKAVEHLRGVLIEQDAAGVADGELLTRYVRQRDEAAFAALVRRHGPMVLGVCRRVLHNLQDAEDAFQATFLVLVRNAATVRCPGTVGNWLYGVAYRTAQHARRAALKRRAKEAKVVPKAPAAHDAWTDLRDVLDQELERLPDKYRAVVVLCDLGGATGQQAGLHLGLPAGTVASRLARGRAMLAKRLTRHGLAIAGTAVAGMVSQNAAASVPAALVSCTIKAASLFAAGQAVTAGVISAPVAALTERVLRTMLVSKFKVALAAGLLVCAVGAGVGVTALNGQPPAAGLPAAQPRAAQKGGDLANPPLRTGGRQEEGGSLTALQRRVGDLEKQVKFLTVQLEALQKDRKPPVPAAAGKRKVHIFSLRSLRADEVAKTLRELFHRDVAGSALSIAGNAGTNTVLVQGGPEDIEEIEAVITRLERQPVHNTDKDKK